MMHGANSIFVIDADPAARAGFAALVATCGYGVQAFASAESFLAGAAIEAPCCAVLDTRTAELAGYDLRERIAARHAATAIVSVSQRNDVETGVAAMKAGAIDFLLKPVKPSAFLDAITRAVSQSLQRRADISDAISAHQRYARLSPRERQIFDLVLQGMRNKQIAQELGSCEATVKVHRARIAQKPGARPLVDLLALGRLVDTRRPAGIPDARMRAAES